MRFPNLTHVTLAVRMTCAPDSLLALSKLQSLEIALQWQQEPNNLISVLNKLPSLRRLAIGDNMSAYGDASLTREGLQQVFR